MLDIQRDVERFMLAADQPVSRVPKITQSDQENLYMDLIAEEYAELITAMSNKDIIESADAIADLIWVAIGLASTIGIPFDQVWNEVKRSNDSKTVNGTLMKNPETGKVMKPPTFSEPDLNPILFP
jgi:phosphoribosyl-ATP pyrophosphohydrolase|tara:strand:- start:34 stop:411 length:378 start_codon:yes stop_codon:yes gene_type:complete